MSDRSTGLAASRVTAVLGPTNTGKTHLAVERMLGHASGMIGLPLRLLAREIYERIVKLRGAAAVALITGEEKIVPPRAHYFVCTVEAMPMERTVEFLAIDEIQLVADPERGHIFTQRLLHARGRFETMFLGAGTMEPLIRRLVPDAEIVTRDRLSVLSYAGSKKLTRLPRRSAIVAFSTDRVYSIAELIRRQRGGAAVVMGSLSPRTRNAQVELYQSGEVDFLVATDAIGMGLNMDVDHVAFAGLRKFDGRRTRWLHAQEIGQIAGRAGRHLRDGTFGVTAEADELDPDLIEQVVEHRFDPVEAAEWRNARLDFDTLPDLLRSLTVSPGVKGLNLTTEALDETLLRRLIKDEEVARIGRSRGTIMRLWEACQLPDFQKTTLDEHSRLAKDVFTALTSRRGRLTDDWIAPRFKAVDRDDGQIDQLSARLSAVRTLTYIANRPDWLHDAATWREKTKALEDRLSDVLHERLTARFVDRRTTALMRALNVREDSTPLGAGVTEDGEVTVEGQLVGFLDGVCFTPEKGSSALENRALRQAALQAVTPEIVRRLGSLAAAEDEAFALTLAGEVLWNGKPAARVVATAEGADPFAPQVRMLGELGPTPLRERARRHIETWLAREAGRALRDLRRLRSAVEGGTLKGLPRGIAFRLIEAGGVIDRREIERDLHALSPEERRGLRAFAIRIGTHSVWLPGLQKPRARLFAQAFTGGARWSVDGQLIPVTGDVPPPRALAAHGLRHVARWLVPIDRLEAMATLRAAGDTAEQAPAGETGAAPETPDAARGRPGRLSDTDLAKLGWSASEAKAILAALRIERARQPDRAGQPPAPPKDSPFAALAALTRPPEPAPRKPASPKRRPAKRRPAKERPIDSDGAATPAPAATEPATTAPSPEPAGAAAEAAVPDKKARRRRRRRPARTKAETTVVADVAET